MSEKRILCLEVSGECLDLRVGKDPFNETEYLCCAADIAKDWKDISKDTCKNCKKARYRGITRERAIEKMAKAIYEAMCPNFSQVFVGWRNYTKIAEAVLNALLEGKHEN